MKNLSTRSKLILVVVVSALPALALTLYSAFEERALNLAGIALATILLLLGAWYGTEVFVLRNIRTLLHTARRVRSGDLGARTGLHHEKDELNQVGREFDEMAETLQRRDLELKKALQELQEQAITDPLTGLHNTRYLRELLLREMLRAKRKDSPLAAIMIDVDHFRRINDSLGHEAGDEVLKELGALFKKSIRGGSDIACRYGGEEFAIILADATSEGARRRAEDIRAAVKRLELRYGGKPVGGLTVSLGVALFPYHADQATTLLRKADEALYQAKAAGRDRVVVSDAGAAPRGSATPKSRSAPAS
jgi:diguanylate cyclase (GGDEF)-like protein